MKLRNCIAILLITLINHVYGQSAIDFTMTDTKGNSWNLYDELASGKTVVLDFFFADCTPCQKLTPALVGLLAEYDQDSLIILGISDRDENTKIEEFETAYGVTYPSAGSEGGGDTITNLYKSYFSFIGWPTYAVVCPNREIHWDVKRDTNFVEMRQKIQECTRTLSAQSLSKPELKIFPNPAASCSIVSLDYVGKDSYQMNLISSTGQVILSQLSNKGNTLELPKCANGIYYIEVLQNNALFRSKIIIYNN